jgi:hypothetical protein
MPLPAMRNEKAINDTKNSRERFSNRFNRDIIRAYYSTAGQHCQAKYYCSLAAVLDISSKEYLERSAE